MVEVFPDLPRLPMPREWYHDGVISDRQAPVRVDTPQGYSTVEHFRQTISRRALDASKIVQAATYVINAPKRTEPPKIVAMQLVEAHYGEQLPVIVLEALAAVMSISSTVNAEVRVETRTSVHGKRHQRRVGSRLGERDLPARMDRAGRVVLHRILRDSPVTELLRQATARALRLLDKAGGWRREVKIALWPDPKPEVVLSHVDYERGEFVWREIPADQPIEVRKQAEYGRATEAAAAALLMSKHAGLIDLTDMEGRAARTAFIYYEPDDDTLAKHAGVGAETIIEWRSQKKTWHDCVLIRATTMTHEKRREAVRIEARHAAKKQRLNDLQLAAIVGVHPDLVTAWRKGKSWKGAVRHPLAAH